LVLSRWWNYQSKYDLAGDDTALARQGLGAALNVDGGFPT